MQESENHGVHSYTSETVREEERTNSYSKLAQTQTDERMKERVHQLQVFGPLAIFVLCYIHNRA